MNSFRHSSRRLTFSDRCRSFQCACSGVWLVLSTQRNAWLHLIATGAVCLAGGMSGLTGTEWCWLVMAISMVWTAEAFNTSLELLGDAATPEPNLLTGQAKDVAAGAVLLSALGAAVIGVLILGPRLWEVLRPGTG